MLSIKGKTDLNNILREYGSLQTDPKELHRIFKTATDKKGDELPFLKIDCNQVSNDVKFSRDFTDYVNFTPNNNIVLTLVGVVVPVKTSCISIYLRRNIRKTTILITVPFTVIPVQ